MLKRTERNLIVGLDIGTSKVVALVGEVGLDGSIELLGLGSQPSRGLKKGVVVNIESTVQSIQRAVEEAELMAGCEIHSVFAGIAGSHVRSLNSHGVTWRRRGAGGETGAGPQRPAARDHEPTATREAWSRPPPAPPGEPAAAPGRRRPAARSGGGPAPAGMGERRWLRRWWRVDGD